MTSAPTLLAPRTSCVDSHDGTASAVRDKHCRLVTKSITCAKMDVRVSDRCLLRHRHSPRAAMCPPPHPLLLLLLMMIMMMTLCAVAVQAETSGVAALTARVVTPTAVEVTWTDKDQSDDSTTYFLRYAPQGNRKSHRTIEVKEVPTVVNSLDPNVTYVFKVRKFKDDKPNPWSDVILVTTNLEAPQAVQGLTARPLSHSSVQLSWALPRAQPNLTSAYVILWAETRGNKMENSVAVSTATTQFQVKDLLPHWEYSFRVRTETKEGSAVATKKVFARPFSSKPAKPPRNVQVDVISHDLVTLRWDAPPMRKQNGDITQYKLQYKRKGGRRGDLCTLMTPPRPREFNMTDLARGTVYRFRLAARTVNGTGPFSKWDTFQTPRRGNRRNNRKSDRIPASPRHLLAVPMTATSVKMTWRNPIGCCPVLAHRILVRNVEEGGVRDIVVGGDPLAFINDLDPDTPYEFNVTAFNKNGPSAPSKVTKTRTLPPELPEIAYVLANDAVVGETANLTCAAGGDPTPEVRWYFSTQNVPLSEDRSLSEFQRSRLRFSTTREREEGLVVRVMELAHVEEKHAGSYTCRARNAAGDVTASVNFHVMVPPRLTVTSGASVAAGGSASLLCMGEGVPTPHITWLRLSDGRQFSVNSTLAQEEDSSTPLPVETVSQGGGDPQGVEGEGEPEVFIVERFWDRSRQSRLILDRVRPRDSGDFSCHAHSQAGTATALLTLEVRAPPPPPVQELRGLPISPHRILLQWEEPRDYPYNVSAYNIRCRPEGGEWEEISINTSSKINEVDDLRPFTNYSVKVVALTPHGPGEEGDEVIVQTLPDQGLEPTNVSALSLKSSMIQLDWDGPEHIPRMYIRGYNILYRRKEDLGQEELFIEGNRRKQFRIRLNKEGTYFLRIATVLTWGQEAPSQWIKIERPLQEMLTPSAPTKVKAVPTSTSIRVSWVPPERLGKGRYSYLLVYGNNTDPFTANSQMLDASIRNYLIRGLVPETRYILSVRAVNDFGESEPVYIRGNTLPDFRPRTVQNASARALSSTEILVQWRPPARGLVTRYQIRHWRPGKRDKESAWLQAPASNYIAGSLQKHSQYRFEIIPYYQQLIGDASVIFAETLPDVPDAPPANVQVLAVNETALRVTWEPPPEESRNGEITHYKVILKKRAGKRLGSFVLDGGVRNTTVTGLEPGTIYKVKVHAITVAGQGPSSKWSVKATAPVTEPRPPSTPPKVELQALQRVIFVTWTMPRDSSAPISGFVVGHGRYIPDVYRAVLSASARSHRIEGLEEDTKYIVSLRSFNSFGESPPVYQLVQTKKVGEVTLPLLMPVNLKAVSLTPTSLTVTWYDPGLGQQQYLSDGRYYSIRYSALSDDAYKFFNSTSLSVTLTDLRPFTKYEVSVRAVRGTEESDWSLFVVNSTRPTIPADAPLDLTVIPHRASLVDLSLSWQPLNQPNGQIEEYFLYYTADRKLPVRDWSVESVPGDTLTHEVTSLTPHTHYYFRLQARNNVGYGPLSDVVVYSPPTDARAAPSALEVRHVSENASSALELSWKPPQMSAGLLTGYMIYYSPLPAAVTLDDGGKGMPWQEGEWQEEGLEGEGGWWEVQQERGTEAVVVGLRPSTTYRFKVRARYAGGLGPFSPTLNYTTDEASVDDSDVTTEELPEDLVAPGQQGQPPRRVPLPPSRLVVEGWVHAIRVSWEGQGEGEGGRQRATRWGGAGGYPTPMSAP